MGGNGPSVLLGGGHTDDRVLFVSQHFEACVPHWAKHLHTPVPVQLPVLSTVTMPILQMRKLRLIGLMSHGDSGTKLGSRPRPV